MCAMTRIRRSLIEVPGHIEESLDASKSFEADVVMLDIEDSVPATDAAKVAAREGIRRALRSGGFAAREVAIRVNRPGSPWFLDDARLAVDEGVQTVVIPKAYSADEMVFVEKYLDVIGAPPDLGLILIMETPGALLDLEIMAAKCPRINGIVGGASDYTLETGSFCFAARGEDGLDDAHLVYNRQRVLAVARANGWSALDGLLVAEPLDFDGARQVAMKIRRFGYDGCTMFYPPHIGIVNDVFMPRPQELAWADQVISAYRAIHEGGPPALYAGGRAVDLFHYNVARRVKYVAAELERTPVDVSK